MYPYFSVAVALSVWNLIGNIPVCVNSNTSPCSTPSNHCNNKKKDIWT